MFLLVRAMETGKTNKNIAKRGPPNWRKSWRCRKQQKAWGLKKQNKDKSKTQNKFKKKKKGKERESGGNKVEIKRSVTRSHVVVVVIVLFDCGPLD